MHDACAGTRMAAYFMGLGVYGALSRQAGSPDATSVLRSTDRSGTLRFLRTDSAAILRKIWRIPKNLQGCTRCIFAGCNYCTPQMPEFRRYFTRRSRASGGCIRPEQDSVVQLSPYPLRRHAGSVSRLSGRYGIPPLPHETGRHLASAQSVFLESIKLARTLQRKLVQLRFLPHESEHTDHIIVRR